MIVNRTADLLLALGDLAALVPEEYAAYRPLVSEAAALFLGRLSPDRQVQLLRDQERLPPEASAEERLVTLMHGCPTLHKLGQVVARDRRLSCSLRRELQRLESLTPRTPIAVLRTIIEQEIPGSARRGVRLDDQPLAEASVASIVGFTWEREADTRPVRGVFKVLKPGVVEALEEELAIWPDVGALLDDGARRYGLAALDYEESFNQVRDLLAHEVRFAYEQENIRTARRQWSAAVGLLIPDLLPFCTPTVTAMERIEGVPLSALLGSSARPSRRLATIIVEGLIAEPLLCGAEEAIFHADPHAGNLMSTEEGELAVIDWSLTGRLSRHARRCIVQILIGGWMLDGVRVERAIDALAATPGDARRVREEITRALQWVRRGGPPGLTWMVDLLDGLVVRAGVRFDADLMMFRKALLTLSGVLADLDAGSMVDAALLRAAFMRLACEWPARCWSTPFSRAFSTHLSNADLLELWLSMPAVVGTAWAHAWRALVTGGEAHRG